MSAVAGAALLGEVALELAKLGASPAVQQYVLTRMARLAGIPQADLDRFIAANQDAPVPPQGWTDEKEKP